jgi:molecular chaperone GrpE
MPSSRATEEQHEQQEQPAEEAPERDLAAELAQMEDRYKRALADLDNYRKRAGREAERRITAQSDAQLREWLEVVDSIERAVLMEPDDPVVTGLRGVLEQMESILARHGVQRIGAPGERFDPERQEAIGVQPADGVPDQTVLSVARSGFTRDGRVLRPAQVVVSRASPE